jgi:organic radical activating enzyme
MNETVDLYGKSTAANLLNFQRQAWSNVVFSLTRRCPLKCAHCVTASAPDNTLPVIDLELSESWALQMESLANHGVQHVTFTGGEPTLALKQITTLASAAKRANLRTALVTSGSWGANASQAERITSRLGEVIDSWDFGYDGFHAVFLPIQSFINAVTAAAVYGKEIAVRICDSELTDAIIADLKSQLPSSVSLIVQPVYAVGRGTSLSGERKSSLDLRQPCLATGPFIREDGSVGPCCAALGYGAAGDHPFEFGMATEDSLLMAWRRWRADPLLRLIRLAGFSLPLRWLEEEGLLNQSALETNHICETCLRLWDREGNAAIALRKRASDPALVILLDELETALYGSVWSEAENISLVRGSELESNFAKS